MVCKQGLGKKKINPCVCRIEGALYLVSKNEEDTKVFEHRTLRDHLEVQHPAHGCKAKS